MSQRKTRGNLNFGRKDNAPAPNVNNSTLVANTPTLATTPPNSATATTLAPMSSNPQATLPTAPANVENPGSSNLLANPIGMAEKEDFGRDKDLKTLLKHL